MELMACKLHNKNKVVVFLGISVTSTMLHMFMLKHTLTIFSMKLKWEMLTNLDYLDATQKMVAVACTKSNLYQLRILHSIIITNCFAFVAITWGLLEVLCV